MAFPKSRVLSAQQLVQQIIESNRYGERFCFILGSGASVESGIPSGNTLEMCWMNCIMGEEKDYNTSPMNANITRECAKNLYEDSLIEHSPEELETAWREAQKSGKSLSSEYYFDIYKLRFYPNQRNGYRYFEHIMETCEPSIGYHTLALLLTKENRNNLVITTNFDTLVEDALFLYTNKKPLIISHESLAGYIESDIQRPIVAKVHRGLMYAPFNTPETTHKLKDEWREALSYAFSTYTPIVIGYGGGDHSLMSFLDEETTRMRHGIYWCYRKSSGLPGEAIQKLIEKKNGYFIAIDGFDALMLEIGKRLYENEIMPTHIERHLKKQYERRVQQYNKQWNELNKDPNMKAILLPVNALEQREEEKREREGTLTAWDYVRRAERANEQEFYEGAIDEYTKAIELAPNNAFYYYIRGLIYQQIEKDEDAIKDYTRAIELATDDASFYIKLHCERGSLYTKIGKDKDAIKDYSKVIELVPDNAAYYNSRGLIHEKITNYKDAIEDYTEAIKLNPRYKDAYCNRARVYRMIGEYQFAREDEKCIAELV